VTQVEVKRSMSLGWECRLAEGSDLKSDFAWITSQLMREQAAQCCVCKDVAVLCAFIAECFCADQLDFGQTGLGSSHNRCWHVQGDLPNLHRAGSGLLVCAECSLTQGVPLFPVMLNRAVSARKVKRSEVELQCWCCIGDCIEKLAGFHWRNERPSAKFALRRKLNIKRIGHAHSKATGHISR